MKRTYVTLTAALASWGIMAPRQAEAHVCNILLSNPPITSVCGDPDNPDETASYTPQVRPDGTVFIEDPAFTGYGWSGGTNAVLGDSHELDGGNFFVFELKRLSGVIIGFANDSAANATPLDTAFSLYAGWLPNEAHDDTAFDPLNPVDDVTFLPVASPTDTAPFPHHRYTVLDRWRDTLHYTQTGGLDANGDPIHPFVGQFNALNDWSMATPDAVPGQPADGNWATIHYLAHRNSLGAGGTERLIALLPAGKYTIAAGGANCDDFAPASSCQLGPFYSGVVSLKVY